MTTDITELRDVDVLCLQAIRHWILNTDKNPSGIMTRVSSNPDVQVLHHVTVLHNLVEIQRERYLKLAIESILDLKQIDRILSDDNLWDTFNENCYFEEAVKKTMIVRPNEVASTSKLDDDDSNDEEEGDDNKNTAMFPSTSSSSVCKATKQVGISMRTRISLCELGVDQPEPTEATSSGEYLEGNSNVTHSI